MENEYALIDMDADEPSCWFRHTGTGRIIGAMEFSRTINGTKAYSMSVCGSGYEKTFSAWREAFDSINSEFERLGLPQVQLRAWQMFLNFKKLERIDMEGFGVHVAFL